MRTYGPLIPNNAVRPWPVPRPTPWQPRSPLTTPWHRPSPVPSGGVIATPDRTPLPGEFFDRPALEAEAYDGPNDPGPHSHRGRTARADVTFGAPGQVYAYFTHDMSRRSA
jgi:DNA-3-methyladenine glycosylase